MDTDTIAVTAQNISRLYELDITVLVYVNSFCTLV